MPIKKAFIPYPTFRSILFFVNNALHFNEKIKGLDFTRALTAFNFDCVFYYKLAKSFGNYKSVVTLLAFINHANVIGFRIGKRIEAVS